MQAPCAQKHCPTEQLPDWQSQSALHAPPLWVVPVVAQQVSAPNPQVADSQKQPPGTKHAEPAGPCGEGHEVAQTPSVHAW
jgi:hypothetical protein